MPDPIQTAVTEIQQLFAASSVAKSVIDSVVEGLREFDKYCAQLLPSKKAVAQEISHYKAPLAPKDFLHHYMPMTRTHFYEKMEHSFNAIMIDRISSSLENLDEKVINQLGEIRQKLLAGIQQAHDNYLMQCVVEKSKAHEQDLERLGQAIISQDKNRFFPPVTLSTKTPEQFRRMTIEAHYSYVL